MTTRNHNSQPVTRIFMTVLIIEDSVSFALELEIKLVKLGHKVLAPAIDNAQEALGVIRSTPPDLIILDIHLNGQERGTELAERIKHFAIPIIFMTSFKEDIYYQEAKKAFKFAYLIKPFEDSELENAIDLLCQNNKTQEILFLKKGEDFHKVRIEDILFIKSEGNYCTLFLEGNTKFINRVSLSSIESLFKAREFLRPHRSYLVNVHKIDTVRLSESIINIQEHKIPITRGSKAVFLEKYLLLR